MTLRCAPLTLARALCCDTEIATPCASPRPSLCAACPRRALRLRIEKLMAEAAKLKEAQAKETAGYNQIQLNFMKPKPLRWSPVEQAVPSAE